MMLWLRNTVEQALRLARQQARQPEHDVGDALDLGFLPTDVKYAGTRTAWPFICVHVTGVRGGFGVSRQLRRKWERRFMTGEAGRLLPELVIEWLVNHRPKHRPILAGLMDRYRRSVPYHRIVSHVGQGYLLHPLTERTPHAGEFGNDGVGFSVDQHQNEPCEGKRAEAARALLVETAAEMQQRGHEGPVAVTAHRCVAKPSRRANDPGANVWRGVVMPAVAARPDLLRIDYEFKRGEGRPIPSTWDPQALYDARGRRLGGSDA